MCCAFCKLVCKYLEIMFYVSALGVGMKDRPLSSTDVSDLLSVCEERLTINLDLRRLRK